MYNTSIHAWGKRETSKKVHIFFCILRLPFRFILLQSYQEHCSEGSSLSSTVSLLEHTSEIVSLFNDKLCITSCQDKRLQHMNNFYMLMKTWAADTEGKPHHFVSSKLWFDLQSMCLGFNSLVSIKLNQFPQSVIKPCIVNQDCVENHFGQIRACNGQNNNPTYLQQQATQNAIRIGQTFISPKSNAAKSTSST